MSITEGEQIAPASSIPGGATGPQGPQGASGAEPESEKKTAPATNYVVLEQKQEVAAVGGSLAPVKPETLTVVGTYEARSGAQAVAAHVKDKDLAGGTFYAVPARSWTPIMVATETQTRLKFS